MKYAKLVGIQKKAHKYDIVAGIAATGAVTLMLCCVFFFRLLCNKDYGSFK